MPKRKRDGGEVENTEGRNSVKQRRVEHKLKVGVTKLGHAFKVAKGFERQKLGRRRKKAVSEGNAKDIARIDSEIEALKTLDTSKSAQEHLYKALSKAKAIAEHPDLPPQVKKPTKASSDAATLNVLARLCKSKPGKTALDAGIADIQQALGITPDKPSSLKKPRQRAKDFVSTVANDRADRTLVPALPPQSKQSPRFSSGTSEARDEYDDNDDVDVYKDRVAFSEHDTGDEFSDVDALEQRLLNEAAPKRPSTAISQKYDVEADLSLSGSNSRSVSASPEPRKAPMTKKTSFLPSLTMGGYISGSDSEIEDVDIGHKRNRRGQRARQQIWEQKYGIKAKHLQKQGASISYDPRRGAVEGNSRQRGRFGRERRSSPDYTVGGTGRVEPGPSKPVSGSKKIHRDDGGALHPSWEAAKKAKEKKEAPVAFQGKKVTFD